jgi:hypothetical protein
MAQNTLSSYLNVTLQNKPSRDSLDSTGAKREAVFTGPDYTTALHIFK